MADTTIVRTIADLVRMNNSRDGNPRYRVMFTDGTGMTTQPDSSIAYGLPNPEFKGVPVRFTVNERRQITHAEPVDQG